MPKTTVNDAEVRTLLEQGLSHRAIAEKLDASKSAVTRAIERLSLGKIPKGSTKSTPAVDIGSEEGRRADHPMLSDSETLSGELVEPAVDIGSEEGRRADHPEALSGDLAELVAWWNDRKAVIHQASDASRQTERTTFHVEHRWIEAIRRVADLDNQTMTQIVNDAFRQYFSQK